MTGRAGNAQRREVERRQRAVEKRAAREHRRAAKRGLSRLRSKISSNEAIAAAHRRRMGWPEPVASVERQPQHRRPVIRVR